MTMSNEQKIEMITLCTLAIKDKVPLEFYSGGKWAASQNDLLIIIRSIIEYNHEYRRKPDENSARLDEALKLVAANGYAVTKQPPDVDSRENDTGLHGTVTFINEREKEAALFHGCIGYAWEHDRDVKRLVRFVSKQGVGFRCTSFDADSVKGNNVWSSLDKESALAGSLFTFFEPLADVVQFRPIRDLNQMYRGWLHIQYENGGVESLLKESGVIPVGAIGFQKFEIEI